MQLQYVLATDANRLEKKVQVLKNLSTYVCSMTKLSIKYLFVSCGL